MPLLYAYLGQASVASLAYMTHWFKNVLKNYILKCVHIFLGPNEHTQVQD